MIPIAWELEKRGIPYKLIDTGQHESLSSSLREQYGIKQPDYSLGNRRSDVNTLGRGLLWFLVNVAKYALRGQRTKRELFDGLEGVVLVHGDTASTLLSALIAKRAGQKVMHIEAGLRSWRLLNPFPEELVRILVMRMSDYLIAPSQPAHDNLMAMSLRANSWHVGGNTGIDIVAADMQKTGKEPTALTGSYCVVTIHRMETLYSRSRMKLVVDSIVRAQKRIPVLFVQHAPTARRLAKYGMQQDLKKSGVKMLDLMAHADFIHLLKDAEFVMTDGGSVQEEAAYLGVPCLLMRMATERSDGLDANVVLSKMDRTRIESFVNDYRKYKRPRFDFESLRPSAGIVDILDSLLD